MVRLVLTYHLKHFFIARFRVGFRENAWLSCSLIVGKKRKKASR